MDILSMLCVLVLSIGLVYSMFKKHALITIIYLVSILSIELVAIFGKVNLFLFSVSYYIHLFYLGYYILVHLFRRKKRNFLYLSLLFIIPMLLSLGFNKEISSYQSYDRLLYILCIIILLIATLFRYFDGKLFLSNTHITIFLTILFYFGIDFIIALTTNYLINEHLNLVGWIWLFRAFCLLMFYAALVNLAWKTGKTL
ncbi:hypothetical protein SAMN04488508_11276 [Aquimarina spongiae]|uniref:YhhN-like protein n=2 Tax=Aquimarina spongiae TaxID=570521 RepID=A0A1M6KUZ0_9FLAO|nr:hypothetical protein SAMN04488508_11276 [Aquimarina spongiae]